MIDTGGLSDEVVVDAVVAVREELDLSTRLRNLDLVERADLSAIEEFILGDPELVRSPPGIDPTTEEIEAVIHETW